MVKKDQELSIERQCELLSIHKSGVYYQPKPKSLEIMILLDKQYFETPFYGALRLTALLQKQGFGVNIKRVRRLMKLVDWRTIYREPR